MVEELVRDYVAQAHAAVIAGAKRGMENIHRGPSRSGPGRRGARARDHAPASARSAKRTPARLEEIADGLYERVRATPGGTMSQFATELGLSIKELQLPRDMLQAQKRIRTTGVRHRMQYYPLP